MQANAKLPDEVKWRLAQLDLELSEGDLTEKGYARKRLKLLTPYLSVKEKWSPSTCKKTLQEARAQRRITRHESRYHSEVRQEAVHRALAKYGEGTTPAENCDTTALENNGICRRVDPENLSASDSSSDEEETNMGEAGKGVFRAKPPGKRQTESAINAPTREQSNAKTEKGTSQQLSEFVQGNIDTSLPCGHPPKRRVNNGKAKDRRKCCSPPLNRASVLILEDRPLPELPADASDEDTARAELVEAVDELGVVVHDSVYVNGRLAQPKARPINSDSSSRDLPNVPQDYANSRAPFTPCKVSHKIQQILQSLQRPRQKALHEYYGDDDMELEATAGDPNAPKAEGHLMSPVRCSSPSSPSPAQPLSPSHSIDSILHRLSATQPDAMAASVLGASGKIGNTLTYRKLLSRASKIAYMLLNKQVTMMTPSCGKEKVSLCLPGDRVALVYPNTEPLAFLTAFYGCLLAGVAPVPIEVPLHSDKPNVINFRTKTAFDNSAFSSVGSSGVHVALTSESCFKGLPRVYSGSSGSANRTPKPYHSHSNGTLAHSPSVDTPPMIHSTAQFPSSTTSSGSGGSGSSMPAMLLHPPNAPVMEHPGEIVQFKGWPRLRWVVTENLPKPSKNWTLPSTRGADGELAALEYSIDRDGCMKGVCVSRGALLAHCHSLRAVMNYGPSEVCISVLDFKRELGLWHGVMAAIYAGMHVVFVPYSVMKLNPLLWMLHATKMKATTALLKSRDLHWSLLASRDANELPQIRLSSLRSIVVADGANPWSLSSCDQFVSEFQLLGLNPNILCPCAGSPETGTLSIRRSLLSSHSHPGEANSDDSGRGVLSMSALSHLVVRIDHESSLNSLTLQDAGKLLPGGEAVVVKASGPATLCKTDEIGEICLHAPSTGYGYFGLSGLSKHTFGVCPLTPEGREVGSTRYVRSGLIGFIGPKGMVFIIGNRSMMLSISGRHHSADDLIATCLAVEPTKAVYRGRIAVFTVPLLKDERLCVVAEQKSDLAEDAAFNWMVRVIQAVDSIHQVGVYCITLVAPNQLPRTPLGGLQVPDIRRRYLSGTLRPSIVLMCPQNAILNLPHPREPQPNSVGPAAMFVGHLVQGARIAGAQGRELPCPTETNETFSLIEILRQRAEQSPEHVLFNLLNSKGVEVEQLTCIQLLKKAERACALLLDRGHLSTGDHVALIFPPGLELITAFYGCLAARLVPVCIRAPTSASLRSSLVTIKMVVEISKAVVVLSNTALIKMLHSRGSSQRANLNLKAWPTILDIEDMPSSSVARRRNLCGGGQAPLRPNDSLYLDFSVSSMGQLSGVIVSALAAAQCCKSLKMACELYPSRNVVLSLDPYSGLGLVLWCLSGVYSGHQTTLLPPNEVQQNPSVWFSVLSQHKARDTFCSYSVIELCVKELSSQLAQMKERGINLSGLRNCVAVAEERPRQPLCNAFSRLFAPLGISSRAVSSSFGCRVNSAICLQGSSSPDPLTVYVDSRALRHDRVTLVEKGAPHSIPLMDSGKLMAGVKVVIANPETSGQCADSQLGEIWVASSHNATKYFSMLGEQETTLHSDQFNARLKTGDTRAVFARTGYLGFLRSVEQAGELHDALFVVGALDEGLWLRGARYHPSDIESTACRSHAKICASAVFIWTSLLVVVAETTAGEVEDALDLVPAITSAIVEEHHLTVGVIMLVDAGVIPVNSRGEKQRAHLKEAFLRDQLDPIYVAYNM